MSKQNDKTVSDSDTKTPAAEAVNTETAPAVPTDAAPKNEGATTFAYIGPALPNGRLKSNTILVGTHAEITEYYKETIELYPSVAKLIVPVSRLAESREKAEKSGNLLNKYCQEVAEAIKPKGEDE